MSELRFDLQSHSTYSDGALPPAGVVLAAAAAGVELLALTDHDSVDGVREAADAALQSGIRLVTGVEISARDRGARRDLHVLGYGIDDLDASLRDRLERARDSREQRATDVVDALKGLGFEIDEEPLHERATAGRSIGRPHLAQAAVSAPANRARLRAEGIDDASDFLEAYLVPGKPGFRPRFTPSVQDAIEMIHAAGGVAVWAHPFWDVDGEDEVLATIDRYRAAGLDGVECFYPSHTREQTLLLADHCDEHGLLSTGSADFHGPDRPGFNRFRAFETYGREPNLGPLIG